MAWAKLSRPEQLNESCDYAAKREIYEFDSDKLVPQRSFPLEPITMFVDNEKMTSTREITFGFTLTGDSGKGILYHRAVQEISSSPLNGSV
jgi:hypothetical protein